MHSVFVWFYGPQPCSQLLEGRVRIASFPISSGNPYSVHTPRRQASKCEGNPKLSGLIRGRNIYERQPLPCDTEEAPRGLSLPSLPSSACTSGIFPVIFSEKGGFIKVMDLMPVSCLHAALWSVALLLGISRCHRGKLRIQERTVVGSKGLAQ